VTHTLSVMAIQSETRAGAVYSCRLCPSEAVISKA
jgi:hypothetical protein